VVVNENILEIIEFVAEKIQSNIRELEGALIRVIAYANLTNQKINKDLAKAVLKDIFSSSNRKVTPKIVKDTVCNHFNISLADMESAKRSTNLSYPRQIAMYLCRDMTTLSLPKIGEAFGHRDHTTVLHACNKITKELSSNTNLKEIINTLASTIQSD
jgi:chromosomal replication initiator protein